MTQIKTAIKGIQCFTKEDLKNIRLPINTLLIKPERENDEVVIDVLKEGDSSKIKLFIDTQFNPHQHACVRGVVVLAGKEHYSRNQPENFSMQWDNCIKDQVQVGDTIIYRHFSAINVIETGKAVLVDDVPHVFMHLNNIHVRIDKKGNIFPVNGYLLIEPETDSSSVIHNRYRALGLEVPQDAVKKSGRAGIVRYMGTPILQYHVTESDLTTDVYPPEAMLDDNGNIIDLTEIRIGDRVMLDANCDLPVEYPLHNSIAEKDKVLYKVQRRHILAVLPNKVAIDTKENKLPPVAPEHVSIPEVDDLV